MMTRTQTLREPFQRELTSPGCVHMDLVESVLAWIEHHGGDRSRSAILTAAGLIAQSDNRVS